MKLRPGAWMNQALVVLECELLEPYLTNQEDFVSYREPDFDNSVTGIATTNKKGLGNLKLLMTG